MAKRLPLSSRRIAHTPQRRTEKCIATDRRNEVGWYHGQDAARPLSGIAVFLLSSKWASRSAVGILREVTMDIALHVTYRIQVQPEKRLKPGALLA